MHYGRIDPPGAHELFVRQGLVPGEINTRASFVADNQKVLAQAHEEEAKLRRAGIVADEDWQARWYLDRIPGEIHSASGLDAWWKALAPEQRRTLHWSLADLLPGEGSEAERYPKYFPAGRCAAAAAVPVRTGRGRRRRDPGGAGAPAQRAGSRHGCRGWRPAS